MRDPRSWQSGHPERSAYSAWVSDGWQALGKASSGGRTAEGLVFVRAYDRTRNGHAEHVSARTRSAPPGRVVEDMPGTTPGVAAHRSISSGYEQHAMLNMYPVSGILPNPDRMLGAGVGGGRIMRPPLPVLRPTARPQWTPSAGLRPRGGLGPRSWHNQISEQPGEAEAAGEERGASAPAEPLLPSPPTVEELAAQTPRMPRRGRSRNSATEHTPQYERGGGTAQRDADLQALRPGAGKPDPNDPSVMSHPLPDGRTAVTRVATKNRGEITLEIQDHAAYDAGRIPAKATHKFRYGVTP
ncbi:hypothetical protein [Roseomonas haemaphysalidis]|uniref:Uncharacterized protein n=1 Tax=Roseomonas haemaphysalidis TaxID=2768162 RepID=A0ABS3KJE1_9PROT|nr:hypothetical protein [Roseomonas haemaphysalidis]MBO1077587.1 hypothetical protein [Roseomonas haemaphysalidis]